MKQLLRVIGVVIILCGLISSFVNPFSYNEFEVAFAVASIVSGLVTGTVFFALAKIIELLEKLNQGNGAKISEVKPERVIDEGYVPKTDNTGIVIVALFVIMIAFVIVFFVVL